MLAKDLFCNVDWAAAIREAYKQAGVSKGEDDDDEHKGAADGSEDDDENETEEEDDEEEDESDEDEEEDESDEEEEEDQSGEEEVVHVKSLQDLENDLIAAEEHMSVALELHDTADMAATEAKKAVNEAINEVTSIEGAIKTMKNAMMLPAKKEKKNTTRKTAFDVKFRNANLETRKAIAALLNAEQ